MYKPSSVKKPRVLFLVNLLICISFFAKGQNRDSDFVYLDSSVSKIKVTEIVTDMKANNKPYKYLKYTISSTSYSIVRLNIGNYIAEKEVTTMPEGEKDFVCNKVKLTPINDSTAQAFTIEDTCDEIILNTDYYSTIYYGCCAGQDIVTYYDYKTNRKICQGQPGIISYQTPGRNVTCYVGYTLYGYWTGEGVSRNTLYIAYGTGETYKVVIKDSLPEVCWIKKISFLTNNPVDVINDSYSKPSILQSLCNVKSIDQVNNLSILLTLYFDRRGEKSIEVPITNGKPFGKDTPEQTIMVPN